MLFNVLLVKYQKNQWFFNVFEGNTKNTKIRCFFEVKRTMPLKKRGPVRETKSKCQKTNVFLKMCFGNVKKNTSFFNVFGGK